MALKWKKDGTAKCGPFEVRVSESETKWIINDANSGELFLWSTARNPKLAAEKWLTSQVGKMAKALR